MISFFEALMSAILGGLGIFLWTELRRAPAFLFKARTIEEDNGSRWIFLLENAGDKEAIYLRLDGFINFKKSESHRDDLPLFEGHNSREFIQVIPSKQHIAIPIRLVNFMTYNDYADCIFDLTVTYKYKNIFRYTRSKVNNHKFKLNKDLNNTLRNAVLYLN